MKLDNFEVVILQQNGLPFPEIKHNGHCYIIGRPGTAFRVSIRCRHARVFYPYIKTDREGVYTSLYIDGHHVGPDSILLKKGKSPQGQKVLYEGYLHDTKRTLEGPTRLREFVFGQPAHSQHDESPSLSSQMGTIKIQVKHKVKDKLRPPPAQDPIDCPLPNQIKLPVLEGKKFFKAPSLAAQAGKAVFTNIQWSKWKYKSLAVLETVELRYETAATLLLRKVLDPTNPEHASIISADAAAGSVLGAASAANPPVTAAAAAPNTSHVKQDPDTSHVKQETNGKGQKRSREERDSSVEVIDLTAEPPSIPRLAPPGEMLTCDLTGLPGQQSWKTEKKPVLSL